MKWIGQQVYEYVSRFRENIFLSKVGGSSTLEIQSWSTGAGDSGILKFQKSGTASLDTYTAGNHTTAGEQLGLIQAFGVTDSDTPVLSSFIGFYNDAVSDADSVPGKIIFATSDADDAGEPTTRLTIDDDGTATFSGTINLDSVNIRAVQTSAEAFADNDTSIMTSAAIQDKVQAHFHYQYISFLGNSTVQANGDWEFPGGNGISNHTWTIDSNQSAATVGSTTISVAKQYQHAGVRVPYAGKLVGIYGAGRNANGDRQFAAGLFVGVPDWGTTNSINATLRAYAAADKDGGTFNNVAAKVEDLSRDFTLSAGDMIYPAIRGDGTTADTIQISMTVVIKTLIP
jgi:hypothetical protein